MALRHVLFYASTLRLCGRAWLVMTPELESARLLLRPLQLADAAYTQILFPHWEIVQFLNQQVPWPYPVDGAHS